MTQPGTCAGDARDILFWGGSKRLDMTTTQKTNISDNSLHSLKTPIPVLSQYFTGVLAKHAPG